MSVTLLINGIDKTSIVKIGSASFTQPVRGQRGTSRFILQNLPTDSFYTPVEGQSVVWKDSSAIVFQGTIDTFEVTPLIQSGGGYLYTVTAVSLEQRFDKRFVTRAFASGTTCGAIITSIMATELADEAISVGSISAGETLAISKLYDHARISDVFTELASLCDNFTWYIDPADGKLYFAARTTTAAPFTVLNANVLALTNPTANTSRSEYRNRQHVKISESNLLPDTETFSGDDVTTTFNVSKPIRDLISITLTTGVPMIAVGTFNSTPSDGDAIQVGGWQYTFVQTMPEPLNLGYFTQAVNYVLIGRGNLGTLLADTVTNLVACLMDNGDGKGTFYSSTSGKNQALSTAVDSGSFTITVESLPGATASAMALNSFTSAFTWAAPTQEAVDGASASQTFAERSNIQSGGGQYQWVYDAGGTAIEEAAGGTPPTSEEKLIIVYKPIGFGTVTVDDPAEQAVRAAAEPGSGIYENLAIREDLLTIDAGIAAATALLNANETMTQRITFDTDTTGLLPGQYVAINDTALNVNDSYLIQSVTGSIVPAASGHYWRYRVVAVSGTQTTIEGWAALANKGTPGGVHGDSSGSNRRADAAKAAPLFGQANFGIADDTVGENVGAKYVAVLDEGVPYIGWVTFKDAPTTAVTKLDIFYSNDGGTTWATILPSANKIEIPTGTGPHRLPIDAFLNINFKPPTTSPAATPGTLLRLDSLQAGGATDVLVYIRWKPSGVRGATASGSFPIGMWISAL